jgi:hypothetical protein
MSSLINWGDKIDSLQFFIQTALVILVAVYVLNLAAIEDREYRVIANAERTTALENRKRIREIFLRDCRGNKGCECVGSTYAEQASDEEIKYYFNHRPYNEFPASTITRIQGIITKRCH